MTKDEHIAYWIEESDNDALVMQSLFENGHYTWSLFVGHLSLEKLMKALYVKRVAIHVPRVHNLLKIGRECVLSLTAEQEDFLLEVTTYNIKGRYPDYKRDFYHRASKTFTIEKIEHIKEMREWIKNQLTV